MLFNILTIATLLSFVSATPIAQTLGDLPPEPKGPTNLPPLGKLYFWRVSKWKANCEADSNRCSYSFNIFGIETQSGTNPTVPAFNATCKASSREGGPTAPCLITDKIVYDGFRNVSVSLLEEEKDVPDKVNVQFTYIFQDSFERYQSWNYTGNATVGFKDSEFEILTTNFRLGEKLRK